MVGLGSSKRILTVLRYRYCSCRSGTGDLYFRAMLAWLWDKTGDITQEKPSYLYACMCHLLCSPYQRLRVWKASRVSAARKKVSSIIIRGWARVWVAPHSPSVWIISAPCRMSIRFGEFQSYQWALRGRTPPPATLSLRLELIGKQFPGFVKIKWPKRTNMCIPASLWWDHPPGIAHTVMSPEWCCFSQIGLKPN